MSQIQQKYQDYLQRLGIQSMSSQSDFWQQLKDYHGDWEVHQFTQAVINGNQQSAYDFLYQDLNSCKIAYQMVSLQSTQVL
jgi:hypothetical protein